MLVSAPTLETAYQVSLVTSNLLCTTVFGYLLVFDTVVMPGIGRLSNSQMLQAFQEMDGMIQRNQPVFVASWAGSVLSLAVSTGLATAAGNGDGNSRKVLWTWVACVAYAIGQAITFTKNIPLNNHLQTLGLVHSDGSNRFFPNAPRNSVKQRNCCM